MTVTIKPQVQLVNLNRMYYRGCCGPAASTVSRRQAEALRKLRNDLQHSGRSISPVILRTRSAHSGPSALVYTRTLWVYNTPYPLPFRPSVLLLTR
jgi:hypothetical protein